MRDCNDCLLHVYCEKTGKRSEFHKKPIKRGKLGPPCTKGEDECPKGHYSNPIQLSAKNLMAYFHYLTCKAVGSFPDDEIVRRNARIIRSIEDSVSREQSMDLVRILGSRNV